MLESEYQAQLIKKLRDLFPGCIILKNDSEYIQGIPDLTILFGECWAFLEVKPSERSLLRPNQQYYIEMADRMSFGAIIYPENEEEVLLALQFALKHSGNPRIS